MERSVVWMPLLYSAAGADGGGLEAASLLGGVSSSSQPGLAGL